MSPAFQTGKPANYLKRTATVGLTADGRVELCHCVRATLYFYMGRVAEVEEEYDGALQRDPTLSLALAQRAEFRLSRGRFEDALEDAEKLVEVSPSDAKAYRLYARVHEGLGDYAKAIELLSKAIELDPSSQDTYERRGRNWLRMEQYRSVAEDMTRAIRLGADYPAFYYRALAHRKLGEMGNFRSDIGQSLKRALKASRDDVASWAIRFDVALIYLASGTIPKARELYEESLSKCSDQGVIARARNDVEELGRLFPVEDEDPAAAILQLLAPTDLESNANGDTT